MDRRDGACRRARRFSRRELLGGLGTVVTAATAGCFGILGGGGGDGGDGGGNGGPTTFQSPTPDPRTSELPDSPTPAPASGTPSTSASTECPAVNGAFTNYVAGEQPLLFDFRHPDLLGDLSGTVRERRVVVTGDRSYDDGRTVELSVSQSLSAMDSASSYDGDQVASLSFGGRPVSVVDRPFTGSHLEPVLVMDLPHRIDGRARYFQTQVSISVEGMAQSASDGDCPAALDAAAVRVATSITPNPDTTIESRIARG